MDNQYSAFINGEILAGDYEVVSRFKESKHDTSNTRIYVLSRHNSNHSFLCKQAKTLHAIQDINNEIQMYKKIKTSKWLLRFTSRESIFPTSSDSKTFLILEEFPGVNLTDAMQDNLSVSDSVQISVQILDYLSHMHSNGWVHRDFRPTNIIYCNGKIKVIDYGQAGSVDKKHEKYKSFNSSNHRPIKNSERQLGYTRRDELEGAFYTIWQLFSTSNVTPWRKSFKKNGKKNRNNEIALAHKKRLWEWAGKAKNTKFDNIKNSDKIQPLLREFAKLASDLEDTKLPYLTLQKILIQQFCNTDLETQLSSLINIS